MSSLYLAMPSGCAVLHKVKTLRQWDSSHVIIPQGRGLVGVNTTAGLPGGALSWGGGAGGEGEPLLAGEDG